MGSSQTVDTFLHGRKGLAVWWSVTILSTKDHRGEGGFGTHNWSPSRIACMFCILCGKSLCDSIYGAFDPEWLNFLLILGAA